MTNIKDSKALGQLIRTERKAQKLTQVELAALTGVGIRFLRELELGKESCRVGLAFQVMGALGMSLNVARRKDSSL